MTALILFLTQSLFKMEFLKREQSQDKTILIYFKFLKIVLYLGQIHMFIDFIMKKSMFLKFLIVLFLQVIWSFQMILLMEYLYLLKKIVKFTNILKMEYASLKLEEIRKLFFNHWQFIKMIKWWLSFQRIQ
jgi:hypothetical protein